MIKIKLNIIQKKIMWVLCISFVISIVHQIKQLIVFKTTTVDMLRKEVILHSFLDKAEIICVCVLLFILIKILLGGKK